MQESKQKVTKGFSLVKHTLLSVSICGKWWQGKQSIADKKKSYKSADLFWLCWSHKGPSAYSKCPDFLYSHTMPCIIVWRQVQ